MLPDVPQYALREAFKKRDVKVNGQRVGMDAVIEPGAEVQIYTRDLQPKAVEIPVIYQDERLLVVFKPAGVSCEPDAKGGQTLPQLLKAQMDLPSLPLLCHRLDNPTEGLILLAKDERIQQLLQDAFRSRQIHKTYTCIVRDTPSPARRVMTDYLVKDAQKAHVRVLDHPAPGAKQIITEYSVLQPGRCARLSVRLHTGRTHQIRAHMASIGHPLLGDDLYGDRAFNKECKTRRLMLCSTELRFSLEGELGDLNQHVFTCKPTF
jgi:23S rRNA pseudouridine955/2504/2580 synthase